MRAFQCAGSLRQHSVPKFAQVPSLRRSAQHEQGNRTARSVRRGVTLAKMLSNRSSGSFVEASGGGAASLHKSLEVAPTEASAFSFFYIMGANRGDESARIAPRLFARSRQIPIKVRRFGAVSPKQETRSALARVALLKQKCVGSKPHCDSFGRIAEVSQLGRSLPGDCSAGAGIPGGASGFADRGGSL